MSSSKLTARTGSIRGSAAIVTGSTSGIGLGIAYALAAEGVNLVLNGFGDAVQIEQLRSSIASEFGVTVIFCGADIGKPAEVRGMIDLAVTQLGGIDILVNNAGIQHTALIEDFPDDQWDAIMAINLSSNFHAIKAALPHMRAKNWGRIINVASVHGLVASATKSAYVAAKHGVLGLTKAVALETARTGITCNAICPGWVLTPLVQKQIDAWAARDNIPLEEAKSRLLAEKQPSGEFSTPEQIGGLVVFLCSDAASQMRGAAVTMDGGWTAQ
jgi:3-hydroxybutyrate dehydrogenase